MTADNSTAVNQQQPVSSDNSAAVSQQQPAQEQPVSNSQLRDNHSTATTQQQSGNKPAQQQPVDNRELSHNQLTTTTSTNNFVGPALMINNHRAEGVCQTQCSQHATEDLASATCTSPQAGVRHPHDGGAANSACRYHGECVGTSTQRREEVHRGVNQSILNLTESYQFFALEFGYWEVRV